LSCYINIASLEAFKDGAEHKSQKFLLYLNKVELFFPTHQLKLDYDVFVYGIIIINLIFIFPGLYVM